jgi:signal transduction histidine kinase
VPAEMLSRAFDLLTTTKTGHAGVGLPIAQRIVAAHGGTIQLVSEGASGTTVTVVLR